MKTIDIDSRKVAEHIRSFLHNTYGILVDVDRINFSIDGQFSITNKEKQDGNDTKRNN